MNKYYIGYQLPNEVREEIRSLYMYIMGNCELQPVEQLHITALHLGERPHEEAVRVFTGLPRRTLPISVALDTYQRFGNHLVVTLQANAELTAIHKELQTLKGGGFQDSWGYNPHITIASGKKAFIRRACPEASFLLTSITLFEKKPGGMYAASMTSVFQ